MVALLRKIACEAQGRLDVFGLGTLVSARQKNNQLSPPLLEIHPITGTIIDSQLRDTFANRLNITGVSGSKRSILAWTRALAWRFCKASSHCTNRFVLRISIMQQL
jgi:hypothetical protein